MTQASGIPPEWVDGGFLGLIDQCSDEELGIFIHWIWRELQHRIDIARATRHENREVELVKVGRRFFRRELVE